MSRSARVAITVIAWALGFFAVAFGVFTILVASQPTDIDGPVPLGNRALWAAIGFSAIAAGAAIPLTITRACRRASRQPASTAGP